MQVAVAVRHITEHKVLAVLEMAARHNLIQIQRAQLLILVAVAVLLTAQPRRVAMAVLA